MTSNTCEQRGCIYLRHDTYGAYCNKHNRHINNQDTDEDYSSIECNRYNSFDDDDY